MKIHQRIKDRKQWLKDLWEEVRKDTPDEEVARIIYRRLVFEEK